MAIMHKRVGRSVLGDVAIFLILFIAAVFMVIPLIFVVGNAFKPLDEIWVFPPRIFPRNPTFKNFKDMFTMMDNSLVPFSRYIMNTVMITGVGTLGNIICVSMCSYSLSKKKLMINKVFFEIIVLSLMFSTAVTGIPSYLVMAQLGWIDTNFAIIIPAFATSLGLYLMKQFMEQIPDSLLESARIDGANEFTILWRIVMPVVKPAWLTLIIFSVQALWGLDSSTYIYSEQKKTLTYALGQITTSGIARAGVGGAVTLFMLIVPVTIFIFAQSNILQTMASSGLKE